MDKHNQWWREKEECDLAAAVQAAMESASEATLDRQQEILESYCLYGDLGDWAYTAGLVVPSGNSGPMRNVVANAVDTLVAELGQTSPRALFTATYGGWHDSKKAERLTSWCERRMSHIGIESLRPQQRRDGIIAGLGILRVYAEHGEMSAERIFPPDLKMDDRACDSTIPRSMYLTRRVDREHLRSQYKECAAEIDVAGPPTMSPWYDATPSLNYTDDVIEVIEAWHLPSGPDARDGRHCIAIDNCVLLDREWERQRFPFSFFRPVKPVRGFWGIRLPKRAERAQRELIKVDDRISEAMHYHARMIVFVPRGAGIPEAHITNDVGTTVPFDGAQPPVAFAPPPMPPDVYQYRERLKQDIYEEFAVNELQAQGERPTGISSGKALRTLVDQSSRRFIDAKRADERANCDLAREMVYCQRQISEEAEDTEEANTVYEEHGRVVTIPFDKIDLDDKKCVIEPFPSSALPNDPAGRIEALQEMYADKLIDREEFWKETGAGLDFYSIREMYTAPEDRLHSIFTDIVERGRYVGPEPTMNLARGVQLCLLYIARAENYGEPESNIAELRRWIADANDLLEQAKPPPPPMPMGAPPPMGPGGPPMDPMMGPGGPPPIPIDPGMPPMDAMGPPPGLPL